MMRYFFIITLFLALVSCDKFEGDQTIPAYLSIDSLAFVTVDELQGTASQKIQDVWVYVDDDLIGGFELPAIVPVLKSGPHKLELRAGIVLNGISDTRAPNPCWFPMIFSNFAFTPDSITHVSGTTSYYDNAEFHWMENFEDASLAIKEGNSSDTGIVRTYPANAPGAFLDDYSRFSGVSYLDTARSHIQLVSDSGNEGGFVFDRGDFIFLELNYKNNIPLVIGVYIKKMDNTVEDRSFLVLSPSEVWNKIYINFTPIVNETVDAVNYNFYIDGLLPADQLTAEFMLDNIKLVTRPNL